MTAIDIAEWTGYCMGAWATGYLVGYTLLAIRKFSESV